MSGSATKDFVWVCDPTVSSVCVGNHGQCYYQILFRCSQSVLLLEAMIMPISQLYCCKKPNCYESPALPPGSMVISVIHADTGYDVDTCGLCCLQNQCGIHDPTDCEREKRYFCNGIYDCRLSIEEEGHRQFL